MSKKDSNPSPPEDLKRPGPPPGPPSKPEPKIPTMILRSGLYLNDGGDMTDNVKQRVMPGGALQGDRLNKDKPVLSMVLEAQHAIEGIARVLEFGAQKYDRSNWKRGLKVTEILDSMLRHQMAYLGGENIDTESGLPHVDHIACNALFLAEMTRIRPGMDDRQLREES